MRNYDQLNLENAIAIEYSRNVLKRRNIFVLDDDENQLRIIEKFSRSKKLKFGINLNAYTSTDQFIDSVDLELVDLFIIDINLDHSNGIKLAKFFRSLTPFDIPVVFISSDIRYGEEIKFIGIRKAFFLPKPLNQEKLIDILNRFFIENE